MVFQSKMYHFDGGPGGGKLSLKNVWEQCIRCGKDAKLLDGTFQIDKQGVTKLLSGPQFTIDILNQLKSLAEQAQNSETNITDFSSKAEKLTSLLGFLKYCVPTTNEEMKQYLLWLIQTIVAIISLKNC